MVQRSHLFQFHKQFGKLTEFAGFEMPIWYRGIIEEHRAVRTTAGLFDVSHMGRFSIEGKDSTQYLNNILPTDLSKVKTGRAFYSTLCNEDGGILDDTVTNKISERKYLMVVNASNRAKDFEWLENHINDFSVELKNESDSTALIALQGPLATPLLQKTINVDLSEIRRFGISFCRIDGENCLVSRTGYTGEDGYEIVVIESPLDSPARAEKIWAKLLGLGREKEIMPCGLGARDLLRLEAGMCLYDQDIDEKTTPIEAALDRIVSLEKASLYPGRAKIEEQIRKGTERRRVAFLMDQDGIPRHGYDVFLGSGKIGDVTSGSFSPLLKKGIGMAYVPRSRSEIGQRLSVKIRDTERPAVVVKTPFYDTSKYGYSRS